ncbi:MAG: F0F1 ATP synthase subunit delta [Moraxella sp.]|uniref:F0F1 ATP synthase subunit delta n=1 Tax=Moraxella sp. TaxID=479 RepID=UPI0026DCD5AE|nr:F0F1 ATP synthase subunit delta [Moraxella sp.]MDO4451130.1 F0F1 ATP synthase subunit delta [Moraxella sp.]
MAELSTLARPYAKAAFDYAKEQNAINEWEDFLLIASEIVHNDAFIDLLNNPAISSDKKTSVLMDIYTSQKSVDSPLVQTLQAAASQGVDVDAAAQVLTGSKHLSASKAITNFVSQLSENGRLSLFPEICTHYSKLKSKELKQVDAYVTSAYPLTDAQRKSLQESLAVSTGSIVILHEAVDSSLLGGATIKVGDKFTDGSVRGKLKQLQTQLTV